MMPIDEGFFYRGTTLGWPGNDCLKAQEITCVTTDPIVAIIFAVECRSHGQAIILLGQIKEFDHLRGPDNLGTLLESSVNLLISPEEFAQKAAHRMDVDHAIEIITGMGFDPISTRINGVGARRIALEETYKNNQRLNLAQIGTFNRLVFGRSR